MRPITILWIVIGFVFNLAAAQPTDAELVEASKVARGYLDAWKAGDFDKAVVLSTKDYAPMTAGRVGDHVGKYIEITEVLEWKKPEVCLNEFVAIEVELKTKGGRGSAQESWWIGLASVGGKWKVCYTNPSTRPQNLGTFKRVAATKQDGQASFKEAIENAKKKMVAYEAEKQKERDRLSAPPPTEEQLAEAVKVAHAYMDAWKAGDYDKAIVLSDKGHAVGTAYRVGDHVTKRCEIIEIVEWKKPEVHLNEFASIEMVLSTSGKRGMEKQSWWIALVPVGAEWKVCYVNPLNKPQSMGYVKRAAAVRDDALRAYNNAINPPKPVVKNPNEAKK